MTSITKQQYEFANERMEELLHIVHDGGQYTEKDEAELDLVSSIVEEYEDEYYPMPQFTTGEYIKGYLEEKGMTAKQLAELLGVSASRVSDFIHDKCEPSLRQAYIICKELDIDPEAFLEASGKKEKEPAKMKTNVSVTRRNRQYA